MGEEHLLNDCEILLSHYEMEYASRENDAETGNIADQLTTVIRTFFLRQVIRTTPSDQQILGRLIPRDKHSAEFDLDDPDSLDAYRNSLKLRSLRDPNISIYMLPPSTREYCELEHLDREVDGMEIARAHRDLMLMYRRIYFQILAKDININEDSIINFSSFIGKFIERRNCEAFGRVW